MKSWHKQLETTNAIGNTANEISGIIRDLKEPGTINNTANTVVETANTTLTIIEIAKNILISTMELVRQLQKIERSLDIQLVFCAAK